MTNTLEYKGYRGSVDYSEKDKVYYGYCMGKNYHLSYEGSNQSELQADFEEAVNDYLDTCAEIGKPPEREIRTTETTNNDIQLRRSYATI
jgi:predicted HicB family RNase H-like nuclease